MPGLGRVGDKAMAPKDAHGNQCCASHSNCIGPAIHGASEVIVNKRQALMVDGKQTGIHASCCGPNIWNALKGSGTVFIEGSPAYRMGDQSKHCGGMGTLQEGSTDVIVGG